jgi:hypothetical protein
MPTFDEMLKGFQSQGEFAKKSTLQWFLNEIKETAQAIWGKDVARDEQGHERSELRKEGEPKAQAAQSNTSPPQEDNESSRDKLRQSLATANILETSNAFDASKIGKLLFFKYDAKTKVKLKYWDMFPICIPFTLHTNGWTGMNLHYLHPQMRTVLLAQLMTLRTTTEMDPLTKLNVTYETLKKSSRFAYFTPCIKRYLISQVRSPLMVVNPQNWVKVALMPLAGFQKLDENTVWQDSIDQILREQGQWKHG